MNRYSVQPRDWIFVKGCRILSFAENIGKKISKSISRNLIKKIARNFLIILTNQPQMHLKLLQKEQLKKQQKQQVI